MNMRAQTVRLASAPFAMLAAVWIVGAWPAGAAAQTPMMENDDVIELLDTPLMQLPIEQGTQGLTREAQGKQGNRKNDKAGDKADENALSKEADARALCDAAMDAMAAGQIAQAFTVLAPHWPLPAQEIQRLARETSAQLQQLTKGYGQLLAHEWVRTQKAGSSLVQHTYMLKLEHHALRVVCTLYKPREHWQVHTVFWDEQLQSLLEP